VDSPRNLDVLVIEDDPAIRELIALSLCDAGHRVIEAGAREATAPQQMADIAAIVLDCNSPKAESARATIRCLRSRFPSAAIIVISGYFSAHVTCHAEIASTLGADCALGKPFTCEELLALVERLTAGASAARFTR
jgi:DNA-binding response OmpR family regulator